MYFYINTTTQSVKAFDKMGYAAQYVLKEKGIEFDKSKEEYVKKAITALGNDGAILNVTAAFDSIANSGDGVAQKMAEQFRDAVIERFESRGNK